MAVNDLEIEIIVREKGKLLSTIKETSNNDIFVLGRQGLQMLEKRISDIGYKCTQEIRNIKK